MPSVTKSPAVFTAAGACLKWFCFIRYLDNMTSERVDAEGVANLAQAIKGSLSDAVVSARPIFTCHLCGLCPKLFCVRQQAGKPSLVIALHQE